MQKVVIDNSTNQVKRYGYTDFENDGSFNPDTETIIESDFHFDESLDRREWFYDSENTTFTKGNPVIIYKEREVIYTQVMQDAEADTQLPRILDAIDKWSSITIALDSYNYQLASDRIQLAVDAGDMTAEDRTLFESKFPDGWDN